MNKYTILLPLFVIFGYAHAESVHHEPNQEVPVVVQKSVTASSNMPEQVTYDVLDVQGKKEYRIRVIGYGAPPTSKDFSLTQKKLMAYRAAQLDAYRLMAEQINGLSIKGQSALGNSHISKDSIDTYVSGNLKGVKILSTEFLPDGTARAIAEYSSML